MPEAIQLCALIDSRVLQPILRGDEPEQLNLDRSYRDRLGMTFDELVQGQTNSSISSPELSPGDQSDDEDEDDMDLDLIFESTPIVTMRRSENVEEEDHGEYHVDKVRDGPSPDSGQAS